MLYNTCPIYYHIYLFQFNLVQGDTVPVLTPAVPASFRFQTARVSYSARPAQPGIRARAPARCLSTPPFSRVRDLLREA